MENGDQCFNYILVKLFNFPILLLPTHPSHSVRKKSLECLSEMAQA